MDKRRTKLLFEKSDDFRLLQITKISINCKIDTFIESFVFSFQGQKIQVRNLSNCQTLADKRFVGVNVALKYH